MILGAYFFRKKILINIIYMKEKKNEAGQDPLTSPESGTVRDKHFRKYNL